MTKQQLAAGKNAELAESAGLANGKRFGVSGKLVEIVDEITEGEYQELMGLTAVEAEPAVSTVPARPIRNCPRFNPKPFVTPFKVQSWLENYHLHR